MFVAEGDRPERNNNGPLQLGAEPAKLVLHVRQLLFLPHSLDRSHETFPSSRLLADFELSKAVDQAER